VYNSDNSGLPCDFVRSIMLDNNQNIWIGTFGGGLAKFDGTDWTVYYTDNSGLPNGRVYTTGQTHETFIFPYCPFVFNFFTQVVFINIAISSLRNDG
jgi:hypothetical protein